MTAPAESAVKGVPDQRDLLKALAAAPAPPTPAGSAIVGMDFDASVAWPIYDWMGVAKAALESGLARSTPRSGRGRDPRQPRRRRAPRDDRGEGIPGFEKLSSRGASRRRSAWDVADPGPVADAICFLLWNSPAFSQANCFITVGGFTRCRARRRVSNQSRGPRPARRRPRGANRRPAAPSPRGLPRIPGARAAQRVLRQGA